MKLLKKWYVHETNWLFVPHTMAYDRAWGPMTKIEALESALWHANQAARNGSELTYSVNIDREPKKWT